MEIWWFLLGDDTYTEKALNGFLEPETPFLGTLRAYFNFLYIGIFSAEKLKYALRVPLNVARWHKRGINNLGQLRRDINPIRRKVAQTWQ